MRLFLSSFESFQGDSFEPLEMVNAVQFEFIVVSQVMPLLEQQGYRDVWRTGMEALLH